MLKRSVPVPILTPDDLSAFKARVEAEIILRQREGRWTGGVTPHYAYQTRPLDWIVEKLGVKRESLVWSEAGPEYLTHEWDAGIAHKDPMVTICQAIADWKSCGVESATGTGKTFLAACLVLWFLACFENALVPTVAPKEDQLLKQLWKELGGLWPQFHRLFPQAEMLSGSGTIRMVPQAEGREKWAAFAFVCGVGADEEIAGRAKGFHAEHMLIVSEETQSIHQAIISSFDHTRTADHNLHLALGNPNNQHDTLHRFCERKQVVHVRISALDYPNIVTGRDVVPAAIGRERLQERMEEFSPPTSRLYLSQIRGVCPKEAEEALIRWEWCEAAAQKYADPQYRAGPLALGADVADSPTGDKAAIARWQGACCTEVVSFAVRDASEVGEKLFREVTDPLNPVDPRYVGIDAVGVGASAVNELKRLGLKVRTISGGQKATPALDTEMLWSETRPVEGRLKPIGPKVVEAERYGCLRDQVWWRLREDLRLGRIALPPDQSLWKDLCAPTFGTPNNRIVVESKDDLRGRLGHSPDKGDACAYGNWVRRRSPLNQTVNEPSVSKSYDRGLEHLLERHEKQEQKRNRQFDRAVNALLRERKREKARRR
jgi:hypothetical protein